MNTEHLDKLWRDCFDEREQLAPGVRGNKGASHADKYNKSISREIDLGVKIPLNQPATIVAPIPVANVPRGWNGKRSIAKGRKLYLAMLLCLVITIYRTQHHL
jgi:hypothetical protein